ncbi:MAG: hypothetical protein KGZ92_05790 [Firmicutes bacterium]|nr:hypothetical protein [Dethiobacter sp.]MBS3888800.1 hypothetical protein [Bacillota bacterium]MBS4054689.1 hypothetical protein [Thermaerobacter sp.]
MNPLQARLVADPADFQWSSYSEYTMEAAHLSEAQKEFLLRLLGAGARGFTEFHRQSDLTHRDTRGSILYTGDFRLHGGHAPRAKPCPSTCSIPATPSPSKY